MSTTIDVLPIVFACDNNYAMPFGVALESLLASKRDDSHYAVYCLVPDDFSNENRQKIEATCEKYPNSTLQYCNVGKEFSNTTMQIEHISHVTYYRLLLPELLPQHDVCLYLDVDIIVCDDLTPMFEIDLADNYLGGVKHPLYAQETMFQDYSIPPESYVNAGVLLMNLKKMRQDNLQKAFLGLVPKKFKTQDQDILNITCRERITYLDLRYNMMVPLFDLKKSIKAKFMYGTSYYTAAYNPVIIHYSNKEKPWDFRNIVYNNLWDMTYKRTAFYDPERLRNRKNVHYKERYINSAVASIKYRLFRWKIFRTLSLYKKQYKDLIRKKFRGN
ncbi:MAG: glycosyltransferase family 8 protein [Desulfovibrionales bacterium]|nr:glycosyltransferase family 8 protein [Desulfovibrionales bacterium]